MILNPIKVVAVDRNGECIIEAFHRGYSTADVRRAAELIVSYLTNSDVRDVTIEKEKE